MGFPASDDFHRSLGALLDELEVGPDDDPLPALRVCRQPVFLKTHALPDRIHRMPRRKDEEPGIQCPPEEWEDSPAFYMVRDGRDAIVSFAHYLREVRVRPRLQEMSFEEVIATLVRRDMPYGGWSGNVGAWRRRPGPTAIVRFEELIEDPVKAISAAASALGVELSEPRREPPSFEELRDRSRTPKLLRRGQAGSWRTEFPPDLLDEFWRRHGEEMHVLGYPRH
jgi:hypothetical protein